MFTSFLRQRAFPTLATDEDFATQQTAEHFLNRLASFFDKAPAAREPWLDGIPFAIGLLTHCK
jgi:hypothetical protein